MRIGELAAVTGASPRALRHYERAGLIGSERADNGYRLYDERAAVRVRNIRHLLESGLTLADVACFTGCLDGDMTSAPPSPQGLRIARERLAVIDARIAAQTEARNRLARALRTADAANTADVPGTAVTAGTAVMAGTAVRHPPARSRAPLPP
ncbi:MerR family transcriptional regulator [Streptomyces sp. MST-110588]|uniref:MerR family transcriptional regulator n=1 Tax=Streptomyces sp. MST-110588 TaxID=2833628 RepID=UPI001F5E0C30|nr:MerR family transcriptional regulator [Streptomyces sp. MST-110588]UNO39267.1 MerR family transcriptional regulator [Streptomyces sp. MST-110588]